MLFDMKEYFKIFPLVLGILAGSTLGMIFIHDKLSGHPIGYADSADKVHVHSDFVVYLDGKEYDLTDDKYQSVSERILHAHIHLHDNNDEVIHRHDHGITLADFFDSIGFDFENDSITDDEGNIFSTSEDLELMVFVNDERISEPANYVNQEEDKILLYYGNPKDNETIRKLLMDITNDSCIYSGTCPERGIAPAESCGLTCEL